VTSEGVLERIHAALVGCGLPTELPRGLPLESLLPAMRADKKRQGGRVAFVVPADGGAAILPDVDLDDALTALAPAEVEAHG
jgi:3-dehydroquinate synthase